MAQEKPTPETADGERERSSIAFPYMDLDDALKVAEAIQATSGPSPCQHDQLAAALGLSMSSSGYRTRLATARLFGLIDTERGGMVKLTPLGQRIVDGEQKAPAKVEAFLSVPLYAALYDELRGKVVPPPAALERVIANLGVSEKQKDKARQAFERSAQAAGFFDKGRDKLVKPAFGGSTPPPKEQDGQKGGGGPGDGGSNTSSESTELHPLIRGLVLTLPKKENDKWPLDRRVHWLQIAVNTFSLLYGNNDDGEIQISVKRKDEKPESDFG